MGRRSQRVAIVAAQLALLVSTAAAQTAGRAVFTRAEVQAAGWQRISEILDAAPGWRVTSTDGFTITPTADGLPAAGASGPGVPPITIIVDGARVPTSMLGQTELEFVPVILAQLDSVVLTTQPRLVSSRIETRGTIEFFTHRSHGTTAQGEIQVGDVANKPGLYQYTPDRPFNREHHGPFHHVLLGYGGSKGGIDVGYRFATLNTTDSLIAFRTPTGLSVGTAQINMVAPTVHADVDAFGGRQSLDATRAHYSGLFFVPAFGHEQALRMYATSVVGSGDAALPSAIGVRYSAGYTADDATPLPSPSPSTLVHRRQNVAASVEARRAVGPLLMSLGAGADRWTLDRPAMHSTDRRLSASVAEAAARRWTNSLAGTVVTSGGTTQVGGLFVSRVALDERDALALDLASTTEAPGENGAWIDPVLLTNAAPTVVRRARVADASWTHQWSERLDFLSGARVSSVTGWPVAQPVDTGLFELTGGSARPPIAGSGRVAAARVGIESRQSGRWYAQVLYSWSHAFGGDTTFDAAARSVAQHQVNGIAWFVPAPGWRVMSVVQAVSSTQWSAFPALQGGWQPTVGAFTRIDLGAEKWLWSRHVRFQYLVRDIFNQSERWQPRAAQFNLRWMAAASFVVGTHD